MAEATVRASGATPARPPADTAPGPFSGRVADRIHAWKGGRLAFLPGLLPALLLYGGLLVVPMLVLGRYSFYEIRPGGVRVVALWTTANYGRFFNDGFYIGVRGETLLTGLIVVVPT